MHARQGERAVAAVDASEVRCVAGWLPIPDRPMAQLMGADVPVLAQRRCTYIVNVPLRWQGN